MKLLIDLRSIHPGRSGGIENYAYFVIDCLKNTDIEIYLMYPLIQNHIMYKNINSIRISQLFVIHY